MWNNGIEPGLNHIETTVSLANQGRSQKEVRYWSWHRLALDPSNALYEFQGEPPVRGSADQPHIFHRPRFSQFKS